MSFAEAGIEVEFKGAGINEVAVVKACSHPEYKLVKGTEVVSVSERYFRPTEVELLIGDATKAKRQLGWAPVYTLNELVKEMVSVDLEVFKKEKILIEKGFKIKSPIEH